MPTQIRGVIKSLQVPKAFSRDSEEISGRGRDSWILKYQLPDSAYPEICQRYVGFPLIGDSGEPFRASLAKGPHLVFAIDDANYSGEEQVETVSDLGPALGNSGNNQIFSRNGAPGFHLERMEVREINKRNVLNVRGYFHSHSKEPQVYINCIFIDANPAEEPCRVEECYLQSFPKESFEEYNPDFERMLASITWAN